VADAGRGAAASRAGEDPAEIAFLGRKLCGGARITSAAAFRSHSGDRRTRIFAAGGKDDAPSGHSDPGFGTYTTLELIWTEGGREMRYFIYFSANASGWWSSEMRTYNGQTGLADWLYYDGTFFQSPLGAAFHGDIDLTNAAGDPYRGELHLHGLVLSTTLSGN
jgi:hypothetical protein